MLSLLCSVKHLVLDHQGGEGDAGDDDRQLRNRIFGINTYWVEPAE